MSWSSDLLSLLSSKKSILVLVISCQRYVISISFWKVARNLLSCLNIEVFRIGCNHLGLEGELGSEFVSAEKCLKDSSKKLDERFLTLCSILLGSIIQFSIMHVWIW